MNQAVSCNIDKERKVRNLIYWIYVLICSKILTFLF